MPSQSDAQVDRVHAYLDAHPSFSETAASLASKLGVDSRVVRRVLDELAEAGELKRRTFERGIEPVYFRYQARAS